MVILSHSFIAQTVSIVIMKIFVMTLPEQEAITRRKLLHLDSKHPSQRP